MLEKDIMEINCNFELDKSQNETTRFQTIQKNLNSTTQQLSPCLSTLSNVILLDKVEVKLNKLYFAAESCLLPREEEYISGLCHYFFQRAPTILSDKESRQLDLKTVEHDQLEQKLQFWQWRKIRSLFIQKRYKTVLSQIENYYTDTFLLWLLSPTDDNHASHEEWTNYLDLPFGQLLLLLRCAYLKCLTLKELHLLGDFMRFSTSFIGQLKILKSKTDFTHEYKNSKEESSKKKSKNEVISRITLAMTAKILVLQGDALFSEGLISDCAHKLLLAIDTSSRDVPKAILYLLQTFYLKKEEEWSFIDSHNDSSVPYRNTSLEKLWQSLYKLSKESFLPVNVESTKEKLSYINQKNPDLLAFCCAYLLDIGRWELAEDFALKLLRVNPLDLTATRVRVELLFHQVCENEKMLSLTEDFLRDISPKSPLQFLSRCLITLHKQQQNLLIILEAIGHIEQIFKNKFCGLWTVSFIRISQLYKISCYLAVGKTDAAKDALNVFLTSFPSCPIGLMLKNRVRILEAIGLCDNIVEPLLAFNPPIKQMNKYVRGSIVWNFPYVLEAEADRIMLANSRMDIAYAQYLEATTAFKLHVRNQPKIKSPHPEKECHTTIVDRFTLGRGNVFLWAETSTLRLMLKTIACAILMQTTDLVLPLWFLTFLHANDNVLNFFKSNVLGCSSYTDTFITMNVLFGFCFSETELIGQKRLQSILPTFHYIVTRLPSILVESHDGLVIRNDDLLTQRERNLIS